MTHLAIQCFCVTERDGTAYQHDLFQVMKIKISTFNTIFELYLS